MSDSQIMTSFSCGKMDLWYSLAHGSSNQIKSKQARVKDKKKVIIQFAQIEDTGARLRTGGGISSESSFLLN